MLNILKELCLCSGVTGNESKTADCISSLIFSHVDECYKDKMGNLIAFKKGKSSQKKIIFSARMDIAGYMVTHIEENGRIRFCAPTKQNPLALIYSTVTFDCGAVGLVLPDVPTAKEAKIEDMYVDIGCTSKSEAEKVISLGDTFSFPAHFTSLLGEKISSNALDSRVCCALLVKAILCDTLPYYDTYFAFCAQGNFTQRGARAAMFPINADISISFDVSSSEYEENKSLPKVTIGGGVGILLCDQVAISTDTLVSMVRNTAKENSLTLQNEFSKVTSSDASWMQLTSEGCATCTLTLPISNRTTGIQTASVKDINDALTLLSSLYKSNFAEITGETK